MAGNYTKPQGWVESPFWETYAANFAGDGSENQLIAALTHSAPQSFLDSYKTPFGYESDAFKRSDGYGSGIAFQDAYVRGNSAADASQRVKRVEDREGVMSRYSQMLQKKLREDYQKNQKSYLDRGKANLREQSQMALDDDFSTIDENANSRGLLYSGKRQTARSGAAAQRANELGSATTGYEQQLADTGRQLNSSDISSDINSLLQQQDLNSIASGAFYNKLQNDLLGSQSMVQGLGSLGSGVGSFAGSMAAKKKG